MFLKCVKPYLLLSLSAIFAAIACAGANHIRLATLLSIFFVKYLSKEIGDKGECSRDDHYVTVISDK